MTKVESALRKSPVNGHGFQLLFNCFKPSLNAKSMWKFWEWTSPSTNANFKLFFLAHPYRFSALMSLCLQRQLGQSWGKGSFFRWYSLEWAGISIFTRFYFNWNGNNLGKYFRVLFCMVWYALSETTWLWFKINNETLNWLICCLLYNTNTTLAIAWINMAALTRMVFFYNLFYKGWVNTSKDWTLSVKHYGKVRISFGSVDFIWVLRWPFSSE